jgi:predicted dehydrogenase
LVEKPMATRAEEALKMHELAEQKGLVLLEAMHIRYAQDRLRSIGVHAKSDDGE